MTRSLKSLPKDIPAAQVDEAVGTTQAGYTCPLCKAQNTREPHDTGWVQCPLLKRRRVQYICYGCCVDIAGTSTAENFECDPYRDIVESAAGDLELTTIRARRICIQHQISILRERVQSGRDDAGTYELLERLQTLDEALETAEST